MGLISMATLSFPDFKFGDGWPPLKRGALFESTAASLPVRSDWSPEDIARAVTFEFSVSRRLMRELNPERN